MKNKLLHNLGWKILSLLVSIVLWLVVTTVNNPSVSQSFSNVPVSLTNTDSITKANEVYEVLEGAVIPKVTIRAPRSIVSELKAENIIAIADASTMREDSEGNKIIDIKISVNAYQDQIAEDNIKGSIEQTKLKVEKKISKTLPIESKDIIEDKEKTKDYIVADVILDNNMVRISGPESVINSISKAVVEYDSTGFISDINTNSEIKLYDKDGNQVIKSNNITQNIKSVRITVDIKKKKEVKVSFSIEGEAAPGFRVVKEYTADRNIIEVAGNSDALENLNEIVYSIDASNRKESYSAVVDIASVLPSDVIVTDPEGTIFNVDVTVSPEKQKRFSLENDDILLTGIPDKYLAINANEDAKFVELIGLEDELSTITKESLNPTINVSEWFSSNGIDEESIEDGFYHIPVEFVLPKGVSIAEPVDFLIQVRLKNNDSGE